MDEWFLAVVCLAVECLAVVGLAVVVPVVVRPVVVVGYAVAAGWGPMWALSLGVLGDEVLYL